MKFIRKLPNVEKIILKYALTEDQKTFRLERIREIAQILSGKSSRKIMIIGPCSADREDAVIDYVSRLARLQKELQERFVIIPRVYTSKPRTNGKGYKGILHRPHVECEQDDLVEGILSIRKMHLHVIQETGMFCADEMLYPDIMQYTLDLLAYVAVGARSVENQEHRLTASGLEIPIGMKNPTSGDLNVLVNSIVAAQYPQSLIYNGWEVRTEGNPYTHAILRGFTDKCNKMHANYHYEDICEFYDIYQKQNLKNMSVIIDCNHANSGKRYCEQIRIAEEIFDMCRRNASLNRFIKGILIESYIEDGAQMPGEGVYGKSITDSCLGWEKTESLLKRLFINGGCCAV